MQRTDRHHSLLKTPRAAAWSGTWWIVAGILASTTLAAVFVGVGRGSTSVVLGLAALCLLAAARLWIDTPERSVRAVTAETAPSTVDTMDPRRDTPAALPTVDEPRTVGGTPLSQKTALARLLTERTQAEPTWAVIAVDAPTAPPDVRQRVRKAIPGADAASPLSCLVSVVLDDGTVVLAASDRDLTFGCAWLGEHVTSRLDTDHPVRLGVALYPGDGTDVDALVGHARAAATLGSQPVSFHDTRSLDRLVMARELATEARRAIHQQEVLAHYQPILDARTLGVVGIEAFARWNHPDRGVLEARDFVGAVARSGAGLDLGVHVFADACARLPRWRTRYAPNLYAAVNTSASQLRDARSLDVLIGTLERGGLPPQAVRLELPPPDLLEVQRADPVTLGRLLALGVELWADATTWDEDTLRALAHPAIRGVKLPAEALDPVTARAFASLHARRGWRMAVKNVETHDQLKAARTITGIATAQGRLVCEPLPPAMVRQFLAQNGPMAEQAPAV